MVKDTIIKQIYNDFYFVKKNLKILGVLLYGSYLTDDETFRSDIDICIVAPNYKLYGIYSFIMENLEKNQEMYDIRFFKELPLSIKGEIIENGEVIISRDKPELYEYFFKYRRLWDDQKIRLKYCI